MNFSIIIVLLISYFIDNSHGNIELAQGLAAREREFPHNVAIMFYRRNWIGKLKRRQRCGGSLINSRTVLTAGHCARTSDRLEIQAGTIDISSEENGIVVNVVNRTFHPEYDPNCFMQNDIALLHLEKDIFEDGNLIRYANIDDTKRIPLNTILTLPGWGERERKGGTVEKLGKATLPLQKIELCNDTVKFTKCDDFSNDEVHLCAGDGIQEACQGDSGASLVRLRNGIDSKRWSIVGISSFSGIRSPIDEINVLDLVCGRGYSGFTRIYPFIEWVWENTWKPREKDTNLPPLEYIEETSKMGQFQCFGIDPSSSDVCNHLGSCVSLDTCSYCHGGGSLIFEEDCMVRHDCLRNGMLILVFSGLVIILCCFAMICRLLDVHQHSTDKKKNVLEI